MFDGYCTCIFTFVILQLDCPRSWSPRVKDFSQVNNTAFFPLHVNNPANFFSLPRKCQVLLLLNIIHLQCTKGPLINYDLGVRAANQRGGHNFLGYSCRWGHFFRYSCRGVILLLPQGGRLFLWYSHMGSLFLRIPPAKLPTPQVIINEWSLKTQLYTGKWLSRETVSGINTTNYYGNYYYGDYCGKVTDTRKLKRDVSLPKRRGKITGCACNF